MNSVLTTAAVVSGGQLYMLTKGNVAFSAVIYLLTEVILICYIDPAVL